MVAPSNVLWTSGWDSTYRVAELVLVQEKEVQPWYVVDSARRSTRVELNEIKRIRAALIKKDPAVEKRLRELRLIYKEDIPLEGTLSEGYKRLADRSHLGSQYDWLARLAKSENVRFELSIHCDDKAHGFLDGFTTADHDGVHFPVDKLPSDLAIFHGFSFPLFDLSKLDMQAGAQENGFDDIMEMTWFCFFPLLDGRPCGFCNPCRYTREEGLSRRVPEPTAWRRAQYLTLYSLARFRSLLQPRVRSVFRE